MKWHHIGLFIALALVACNPAAVVGGNPPGGAGGGGGTGGSPPPAGLTGPVLAALYDGSTVRLWDGVNAVTWKTGAAVHGNGRKIAVGRTLYFLDSTGAVTQSMNLPANPAGVAVVGDPVVYTFEVIDPQTALDSGARYAAYTRVWKDGVEDPAWSWFGNQWSYDHSFECANGDLVAVDTSGHFWDISRPSLTNAATGYQNIAWAWDGGPIFYWPDPAVNAVTVYDADHPEGHPASWAGGNIGVNWGPNVQWILWNGVYYTGLGDTWDGATLRTRFTGLSMWNNIPSAEWCQANGYQWPASVDHPTMLNAYSDASNMYFIECNTGLLIQFTPQTGVSVVETQLYQGNGSMTTGTAKLATLQPALVDGSLYFHDAGTLWRRDGASTVISSFSADQQMWVMK